MGKFCFFYKIWRYFILFLKFFGIIFTLKQATQEREMRARATRSSGIAWVLNKGSFVTLLPFGTANRGAVIVVFPRILELIGASFAMNLHRLYSEK